MLLGTMYPGTYGKFKFQDEFTAYNGVYTLRRIFSWDDYISQGYQVADIYTAVGLSEDAYLDALPSLIGSNILGLIPYASEDNTVLHIPEKLIVGVPDTSVQKYQNLTLGFALGYFTDKDQAFWLKNEVAQLISLLTGSTGEVDIFVSDEQWFTDSEYKEIEDARTSRVTSVDTALSRYQKIKQENIVLKTRIEALEELVLKYKELGP